MPPATDPGQAPAGLGEPASTEPRPPARAALAGRVRAAGHRSSARRRQRRPLPAPPDPWVTTVLTMREEHKGPHEFAAQLPGCPVRQQTLASEDRTPAFLQLATKAAAVATAALTTAPEAPKAIRPILGSARNVTRTGYLATKALGGNGGKTLLAGVVLAILGIVLASSATRRHRADRHGHRPGGPVPDRPGRVGHPPRPAWRAHRVHRAAGGGGADAALGAHRGVGHRRQQHERAGAPRCPALAAQHLVGWAGAARRPSSCWPCCPAIFGRRRAPANPGTEVQAAGKAGQDTAGAARLGADVLGRFGRVRCFGRGR